MKARVRNDQSVRTIWIEVVPGSVADLDVTRSWQRKTRVIRPDHVTIVIHDGERRSMTIAGGLVLKSGAASESARGDLYFGDGFSSIESAPAWARQLWEQAPDGATLWDTVENPA